MEKTIISEGQRQKRALKDVKVSQNRRYLDVVLKEENRALMGKKGLKQGALFKRSQQTTLQEDKKQAFVEYLQSARTICASHFPI